MGRIRSLWLLLGLALFAVSIYDVSADVTPSENECRPYIEKAIHELKNTESTATDNESTEETTNTGEDTSIETTAEAAADEPEGDGDASVEGEKTAEESQEGGEEEAPAAATAEEEGGDDQDATAEDNAESLEEPAAESLEVPAEVEDSDNDTKEEEEVDAAADTQEDTTDDGNDSQEGAADDEKASVEEGEQQQSEDDGDDSQEGDNDEQQEGEVEDNKESAETTADEKEEESTEGDATDDDNKNDSQEEGNTEEANDTAEDAADDAEESVEEEKVRAKRSISEEATPEDNSQEADDDNAAENSQENAEDSEKSDEEADTTAENDNDDGESQEQADDGEKSAENAEDANDSQEVDDNADEKSQEDTETEGAAADEDDGDSKEADAEADNDTQEDTADDDDDDDEEGEKSEESMPEEDLTLEFEIPKNLRSRDHISDLLGLDAKSSIKENALKRTGDVVLKELKRVYDNAIKPLEQLYKYRDLSNRHFGDPEIFSKPLILFMGPWSGGKSTILNYLTDNEYTANSIRSGAEPSPAYFNILMHGDEPEVLDGTQLAADWTFSGLQKFGQGLNDRLRGQKLPSKLLERVNIVEIPGILEVRKQVSRYFPFNDACQWFIDRADIIFLVYDPSKLDVGPETEAILDQLKGREYQTRIVLNKGDQVKPEELMRVQSALIWNISPLMSSAQPPVMYTVSLWSHPFEQGAPVRLLQAQERALLGDLREAIDKRIENKIASARRFAVRIRNHAKMVDCYLTTYYNQKSLFSNKKKVSDNIIEHPQNFNIYEGLSTLTNISRYDLPDPEVYLDFFRLNPLYEFKQLSETCTYFKGCPINKLDIAIAYDLPELVGKYKKLMEENYATLLKEFDDNCNQTEPEPPVKLR